MIATVKRPSADSRSAMTQPAAPAPTMTKSKSGALVAILVAGLDRPEGRHEMELIARIGMGGGDRLVELDAEAGLVRGDDIAVLPPDRRLDDLRVEAAPVLDALEDEEIR